MNHSAIWRFVNDTLQQFYPDFSRDKSYRWFVVVIIGLMVRTEYLGITSIIRDLCINPAYYESFLIFFRADSWTLQGLKAKWMKTVASCGFLFKEGSLNILIGDGTKEPKQGKKMPGVKKLRQESEDSTKAAYIFGHFYGALGVLIGTAGKIFCTPVSVSIQDGVSVIRKWEDEAYEDVSHVVQMIKDACEAVKSIGDSVLLLDRYFLSVPALKALQNYLCRDRILHIVTRAKKDAVAYYKPIATAKPQRGRPCKKGEKVKLRELFKNADSFTATRLMLYGKTEAVRYFCIDLLWGKKLYRELRFVLVCYKDTQAILVSTNLDFTPEQIIRLYGLRQKIEVSFFGIKQVIHGFSSHFWSKAMPVLNRYRKKDGTDPLLLIHDENDRKNITGALKATEGFAFFSCIAAGMLQIISLKFCDVINPRFVRWLRTYSNTVSSEATVALFLRNSIFSMLHNLYGFYIFQIIRDKQRRDSNDIENLYA